MKKTLQRLGIVTVGLSLCLWSCKEQDGILKPSENGESVSKEVFVKDGRLVFDSKESFWKQVEALKTPESIVAFDNKFKGFTSMNEKYDELLKHDIGVAINDGTLKDYEYSYLITINPDGSKEYDIAMRNKAIAAILNYKGILQIGDMAYRLNDKEIAEVPEDKVGELLVKNSAVVKKTPIKRFTISDKSSKSAKQMASSFDEIVDIQPYSWGSDNLRFKTNVTMSLLWGKAMGNYWVTHKKSTWYGWTGASIDGWTFNTNGYIGVYSTSGYNNGYPQWTIPTSVSWGGNSINDLTHYFSFSIDDITNNDPNVYKCTMIMGMNWSANSYGNNRYSFTTNTNYPNGISIDVQ
jgi:hypothetical protein